MKRFLITLLLAMPVFADDLKVMPLIVQGDAEERQHHVRTALSLFEQAERIDANDPGVLLRIAKAYLDLVDESKSPEDKQDAEHAVEYSKRAVQIAPANAKAHLGVAAGYGRLTDFVGSKTKIEYSRIIKDETDRALSLDATDDFAWNILGRWNFAVANVNGLLKALAEIAYGGLPPASNEEAARCYKKAVELAPQRLMHHSGLARAYTAIGKPELAAKEWKTVLTLRPTGGEEENDRRDALKALGVVKEEGK